MSFALPTGGRGQALALGVSLLAVVVVWAGVIGPVLEWYGERADILRHDLAMTGRMAALVATLPALRREAELMNRGGTDGPDADTPAALLTGTTDALAAASLQQQIDALAVTAGARIGSEDIVPSRAEGDLRVIAVRLTMTSPLRSFARLLLALARSDTPMIVDELQVRASTSATQADDDTVEVSMTVTSYRAATPAAR